MRLHATQINRLVPETNVPVSRSSFNDIDARTILVIGEIRMIDDDRPRASGPALGIMRSWSVVIV